MKYKYIILDFGNVIVIPTTGEWDITPKFLELIDLNKIDENKLREVIAKYSYMFSEKMDTLSQEYDMFKRYYDIVLREIKYPDYNIKLAEDIAYDRTYKHGKYTLCENIKEELTKLKEKYTLIMLTDNWPCVIPYLKDYGIYDFFDKIYISSVYGVLKKEKVFFDYPINDYHIKPGEALFIDDTEINLDAAKEKSLDVLLMDRNNTV
ncbi:MAG: HAD family hydrolase, partial [Bacilli bacterium]|nr:HAD family hydrolase [Bacilli bacterium]